MTQKRKVAKKYPKPKATKKRLLLDAWETHDGEVLAALVDGFSMQHAGRLTRDQAAIGAVKLIIAICVLSNAEVRKALGVKP